MPPDAPFPQEDPHATTPFPGRGEEATSALSPSGFNLLDVDAAWVPPADWERYQVIRLLGVGGMGQVYEALDRRLNRRVALKFLRSADPDMARRFLQEAQVQASIDHPHVCPVHEVGEVEGVPYIAMALIEGPSLRDAARELSTEQKARIMAEVCEAIHAAHRLGLIHRDIKPANIMLTKGPDGAWSPVVLDFGLARFTEAQRQTATGIAMGTPAYMSPEQARGDSSRVDRRSDVYSLGATLYELLAGDPPFAGESIMDLLVKVITEEPPRLRRLAASVPPDLDTLVMKCLEKEPERRYDSARALGEDLRRFLDGEPLLAEAPSVAYRLKKWYRRNRAIALVSGVALGGVLAAGAFGGYALWRSRRQAALAQSFGQEARDIGSLLRFSHLMPPHDTRPEVARVQALMARIEAQMAQLGAYAQGPGHFALGSGWMDLHAYDKAQVQLQAAWDAGFRTPEAEAALGQCLAERYQEELRRANQLSRGAAREARKQALDAEFLKPALEHLGHAGGGGAYADGLLALSRGDFDQALAKARAASVEEPWRYEGFLLEARVRLTKATTGYSKSRYEESKAESALALEAAQRAGQIARSDGWVDEQEARVMTHLEDIAQFQGGWSDPLYQQALEACDRALLKNPDSPGAWETRASLQWRKAENLQQNGGDPREVAQACLQSAARALALKPDSFDGLRAEQSALNYLVHYALDRGEDARPLLDRLIASGRRGTATLPQEQVLWDDLGSDYEVQGDVLASLGEDPLPAYDQAIACDEKGLGMDPKIPELHANLSNHLRTKADWLAEHDGDAWPLLKRAESEARAALQLSPKHPAGWMFLGIALTQEAGLQLDRGEDPSELSAQALEAYEGSLHISASISQVHTNMGDVLSNRANYAISQGRDGEADLKAAEDHYRQRLAVDPRSMPALKGLGGAQLLEMRNAAKQGRDPAPAYEAARKSLEGLAKLLPSDFEAWHDLGNLELERGEQLLAKARPAGPFLDRAEAAYRKAAALAPKEPTIHADLGTLALARAEALKGAAADAALAQAEQEAQAALALRAGNGQALGVLGRVELAQARLAPALVRPGLAQRAAADLEAGSKTSKRMEKELKADLEAARKLAAS